MFDLDKWNAELGQSSRRGSLGHQSRQPWASGKRNSKVQCLPAAEENGDQLCDSPSHFSSCFCCHWGRDGGMHKYQANPKRAPTANPNEQQEQAFSSPGTVPASPSSFLPLWEITTLLNCGDIDWQKKYLTADIFKLRCWYVQQIRVCETSHYHSQIFLISYLWILDSQILFLSWRMFI